MSTEPTPLQAFWDACAKHDWTHDFSDDASVSRRGRAAEEGLRMRMLGQGPEWQEMFTGWRDYSFGKPGCARPVRP